MSNKKNGEYEKAREALGLEDDDKRVPFSITQTFIDGQTNRHFGVGNYPIEENVAARFLAEGRGFIVGNKPKSNGEEELSIEALAARMRNAQTGNQAPKGGAGDGHPEDTTKIVPAKVQTGQDESATTGTGGTGEGGGSEAGKGQGETGGQGGGQVDESGIPANFVGRGVLIAGGFDTAEKLKNATEADIAKLFPDDEAKVKKIGVAIGKL